MSQKLATQFGGRRHKFTATDSALFKSRNRHEGTSVSIDMFTFRFLVPFGVFIFMLK